MKKIVLCGRYDAAKVLQMRLAHGVEMLLGNCSECGRKLQMMPETRAVTGADETAAAYCDLCFPEVVKKLRPQLMMTTGQFQEAAKVLAQRRAKNN